MTFWKTSMIKFFGFLLVLISFSVWSSPKIPSSESGMETGIDLRVLKKKKRFILLAESKNRRELKEIGYSQVMLGSYYRLTKRFRMGLFFQAEQGFRWDQDWRKKGFAWDWANIESRWDYSTVLDATYQDTFKRNWMWEFKNRLSFYHSRDALLYKVRPGLRYFHLKEGRPRWQAYTEIEAYIPVNYGDNFLYEYWIYLGWMYQFTPKLSAGPVISYRQRWYHAYSSFLDKTNENFRTQFSSTYAGVSAVYSF